MTGGKIRGWKWRDGGIAALRRAMALAAACCLFVPSATDAWSRPVTCREVSGDEAGAAIGVAEVEIGALWRPVGERMAVAYRLPGAAGTDGGAPPGGRGGLLFPKASPPAAAAAIEGLLVVEGMDCSIYEIGPPRAFVVGFRGKGLLFKEGGGVWSPRLPSGIVQVLAVRRAGERWVASPMPGARTSLPDDAVLSRPQAAVELPPGPVSRPRP